MAGPYAARQGGSRRGRYRPMSEINVTPFVDVMLVLLIVFMVTAPLLSVGVPVDLPKTEAASKRFPASSARSCRVRSKRRPDRWARVTDRMASK